MDGKPLESWSRGHFQGIAILNIPSVYGGTNLWGPTKKQKLKQKDSDTSKIPDIKYAVQGIHWKVNLYRNKRITCLLQSHTFSNVHMQAQKKK